MEEIKDLQKLETEDKVLFEGRKKPLTVEKISENGAIIKGPNGGEYKIYEENDAKHFLIAKPGNERYSSYCKKLRRIGEWEKTGDRKWRHTDTNAEISIIKNSAGFWTLKIEKLEENIDLPKYGFSDLENAQEEAHKILENNPEG